MDTDINLEMYDGGICITIQTNQMELEIIPSNCYIFCEQRVLDYINEVEQGLIYNEFLLQVDTLTGSFIFGMLDSCTFHVEYGYEEHGRGAICLNLEVSPKIIIDFAKILKRINQYVLWVSGLAESTEATVL